MKAARIGCLGAAMGDGLEVARGDVLEAVMVMSWMQLSMVPWGGRGAMAAWGRRVSTAWALQHLGMAWAW